MRSCQKMSSRQPRMNRSSLPQRKWRSTPSRPCRLLMKTSISSVLSPVMRSARLSGGVTHENPLHPCQPSMWYHATQKTKMAEPASQSRRTGWRNALSSSAVLRNWTRKILTMVIAECAREYAVAARPTESEQGDDLSVRTPDQHARVPRRSALSVFSKGSKKRFSENRLK